MVSIWVVMIGASHLYNFLKIIFENYFWKLFLETNLQFTPFSSTSMLFYSQRGRDRRALKTFSRIFSSQSRDWSLIIDQWSWENLHIFRRLFLQTSQTVLKTAGRENSWSKSDSAKLNGCHSWQHLEMFFKHQIDCLFTETVVMFEQMFRFISLSASDIWLHRSNLSNHHQQWRRVSFFSIGFTFPMTSCIHWFYSNLDYFIIRKTSIYCLSIRPKLYRQIFKRWKLTNWEWSWFWKFESHFKNPSYSL